MKALGELISAIRAELGLRDLSRSSPEVDISQYL